MIWLWVALARGAEPSDIHVELYTMGPGDALFSRFGHAALCLVHGDAGPCYNYGSTRFEPLRLVAGFMRASAVFWLSREPLETMLAQYAAQDRRVWRQRLELSDDARKSLVRRLLHDEMPAHRQYIYDHFAENCSTRLRDHLDAVTGGALSASARDVPWDRTYRDTMRAGLSPQPLVAAGTELLVGGAVDRVPTRWEAMFLPDVLREEVAHSLGAAPQEVVTPTHERKDGWPLVGPVLLGSVGALWALVARAAGRVGAVVSAAIASGFGLALWTIVVVSVPPGLRWNLAAALFLPFDLLALSARVGHRYIAARAILVATLAGLSLVGLVAQPLVAPAALAGGLLFGAWRRR